MRKKMEEVKKELDLIISEITELAKSVAEDFRENPTDISGSTIQVHEDSPYVDEKYPDKGWNRVIKNIQKK
tara:strand:+ start:1853 stop:2065 length:213 start_codon:yes stop_codon:yes gene_type:complete